MYENICTLPLSADLFTQAIHPTKPLFAVGLSTGHVQLFRLPPVDSDDGASEAAEKGYGEIETAWRTRRHKGSCRSLGFSLDGESIYSAGTDAIIKVANMENGRVFGKIAVPLDPETSDLDPPSLLHVLSPQTFLIGTDSSALHLYDTRINHTFTSSKPEATHRPHDDYISSLTPLPPSSESTSGFSKQWVTTGGTTLAVTDLRRGVLHRSEDQEEELLSTTIITGLAKKGTSTGEKVLVGGASGVVTLWERGVWDDQDERIVLDRTPGGGESVDCLVDVPGEKTVVAGMGDGSIGFVRIGSNQVVEVMREMSLWVMGRGRLIVTVIAMRVRVRVSKKKSRRGRRGRAKGRVVLMA
ncbi:WD40 repeat-like protein [Tothia fuscella]|uniref:WD repeat-containing protein JIP5 n=1 Tax=Tothia fuscella TaxID=1048955 RepID=A0A9P4P3T7_9PEZI|nr:WD40 repeat-like protein [Tothia fuscella]